MSRVQSRRYKTVLLKLSGETLAGEGKHGFSSKPLEYISGEIAKAAKTGCRIAIVLGGGNLVRGSEVEHVGIERTAADYMGMLATLINGIALQTALEQRGLSTRLLSALHLNQVAEPFIRRRALRHLEKGRIVICVGGTGNPYFTTDTAAALRANELDADVILKGTTVDGVYTQDPKKNEHAKRYSTVSYADVLRDDLRVMDLTAITMAHEYVIPVIVFDIFKSENLKKAVQGQSVGTRITP